MCNCHSYNRDTGSEPEAILDMAQYFPGTEDAKEQVCIDACIAKTVESLWKERIFTRGSCCGHNNRPPSVVLESAIDAEKARKVIAEVDNREFDLLAWVLTSV